MFNKYGFIHCQDKKSEYGMDVFCSAGAVSGCEVGETVEFDVMLNNKGQPQAHNVKPFKPAKKRRVA